MRKRILSLLVLLVAVTGAVAQATTITWDSSVINSIMLFEVNESYTNSGITVKMTAGEGGKFNGNTMYSGYSEGTTTFVFSSTVGNIKGITINAGSIYFSYSGWTTSCDKVTWSGTPASSVSLSDEPIFIKNISSIVFTIEDPAVTLTDGNDISALLPYAGKTCDVSFVRSFAASRPSTVCLPFAYAPKSGEKFYTFVGITWNQIAKEYYADMIEYTGTTLTANTPYLYLPSSTGDVDFGGTYTIPATIEAGTTTSGEWKFIGTYTGLTYGTGSFSGNVYGFAAEENGTVERGQFIKGTTGATVPPMRCYLTYNNE